MVVSSSYWHTLLCLSCQSPSPVPWHRALRYSLQQTLMLYATLLMLHSRHGFYVTQNASFWSHAGAQCFQNTSLMIQYCLQAINTLVLRTPCPTPTAQHLLDFSATPCSFYDWCIIKFVFWYKGDWWAQSVLNKSLNSEDKKDEG